MTSPKREWYEGAVYHITARGNHRNDIFRDEEDFQVYLTLLEEAIFFFGDYNYKLVSYCLMYMGTSKCRKIPTLKCIKFPKEIY